MLEADELRVIAGTAAVTLQIDQVIGRPRQGIQVAYQRAGGRDDRLPGLVAKSQAGDGVPVLRVVDAAQQFHEGDFALAADDDVHDAGAQRLLDRVWEVRPPRHNHAAVMQLFYQCGRPQPLVRGDGLLADAEDVDRLGRQPRRQRPPAPAVARRVPDFNANMRQLSAHGRGQAQQTERRPEGRLVAVKRPHVSRRAQEQDPHDYLRLKGFKFAPFAAPLQGQ